MQKQDIDGPRIGTNELTLCIITLLGSIGENSAV